MEVPRNERSSRFHALVDKVWREDFLGEAWRRVRRNGGSAGVDGEPFADIERYGVAPWLGEDGVTVRRPADLSG